VKYFFIAGEASGDLHASNVCEHLFEQDSHACIEAWGGDLMKAKGVYIHKHIHDLAFMGFAEVLMNLRTIINNFSLCKRQIRQSKPDVVILVDYPGFNLRMAKWCKQQGYKVVYYISPTVWAWKENRVELIRKYVDRLICILPFEKPFYAKHGIEVDYFGNPSVDIIESEKLKTSSIQEGKIIALLPGSRKQEISAMLPIMLEATKGLRGYKLIIAQAPNLKREVYEPYLANYAFEILQYKTYDILKVADAAIVASGTATLEAALFGVPQVVGYIANSISYAIAKRLVKVKYISLVNLILDRPALVELIQHDMTIENVRNELNRILFDKTRVSQIKSAYFELTSKLYKGNVSAQVAQVILQLVFKDFK
jgi:lipid-A-disaccharide synthase